MTVFDYGKLLAKKACPNCVHPYSEKDIQVSLDENGYPIKTNIGIFRYSLKAQCSNCDIVKSFEELRIWEVED